MLYEHTAARIAAVLFGIAGAGIVILGFVSLEKSVSVGLPRETTELKTGEFTGTHGILCTLALF